MGKTKLFKDFIDRVGIILSLKKDKKRDIQVIEEFEKGLQVLSDKRQSVKKELDEFVLAFKAQTALNSSQIQKGDTSGFLVDNLKYIQGKRDKIEKGYIEQLKDCILEYNDLDEKYSLFKEEFLKSHDLKYKDYLSGSLNKTRDSLPQIKQKDIDSYILHFSGKSKNSKVTKGKMKLSSLKPSQNEFNEDKIISGLANNNWKDRTYIISKDCYMMDGHHSWATGLEVNPDEEVSVYKVNLPAKELIRRSNLLTISTKKDVSDNLVKSLFTDFIESDEELYEVLVSKPLVINADGFEKLQKGLPISEDDLVKGDLFQVPFNKSNFKKDVRFIIKGENTHCSVFYYCDEVILKSEEDEVKEDPLPEITEQNVEEEKVSKGLENSEEGVKNKIYSDIIIQDKNGKVLFLKRSSEDTFGAGQYSLPGGKVEDGESTEEAVKREVKEETGLEIKKLKFIKTLKDKDNQTESNYFYAEFEDDVVILDNNEHDNYIWADKEEWEKLDLILDLKTRINSLLQTDIIIKGEEEKKRHRELVIKTNEIVKSFDSITKELEYKDEVEVEIEKSLGVNISELPKPLRQKIENLISQKFPE